MCLHLILRACLLAAPIYFSKAEMYEVEQDIVDQVEGMSPTPENGESIVEIEPLTGSGNALLPCSSPLGLPGLLWIFTNHEFMVTHSVQCRHQDATQHGNSKGLGVLESPRQGKWFQTWILPHFCGAQFRTRVSWTGGIFQESSAGQYATASGMLSSLVETLLDPALRL